jgi:4-amino-4-deoxy-L-arabinose transferase-like glycosyltransferase
VLLLALIAAATLFFRLGALPFIGADEPRYARITEEMAEANRWVTPTLEGRPWLEKPPLYYWLTIPVAKLFGPGEAVARSASAICAFAAALALLWLGIGLNDRLGGLIGGVILLTTLGFSAFGRSASTDMPMTACLTVALAGFARAVAGRVKRPQLWAAWGFLGLAVLAKGPVALILAVAICGVFWCFQPQWRLRRWSPAAGVAIMTLVVVPWFWLAFRENGFAFISVFFINHNLARYVSDIHHHGEPVYYFAPVLAGLLFPWSGWLPLLIPGSERWKRPAEWLGKDPARFFVALWTVLPLVFFSLSRSKLPGYILPVLPPLAFMLGSRFSELVRLRQPRTRRSLAGTWAVLALSAAIAIAAPLVFYWKYGGHWQAGAIPGACALIPAIPGFWNGLRGRWAVALGFTAIQGIALVLAISLAAFPVLADYHSARDIARQAVAMRTPGEPLVTYRFFHHALHYYTDYTIDADLPEFASLASLCATHPGVLIVTEAIRMRELEQIEYVSPTILGVQGKLRLIRLQREADAHPGHPANDSR